MFPCLGGGSDQQGSSGYRKKGKEFGFHSNGGVGMRLVLRTIDSVKPWAMSQQGGNRSGSQHWMPQDRTLFKESDLPSQAKRIGFAALARLPG